MTRKVQSEDDIRVSVLIGVMNNAILAMMRARDEPVTHDDLGAALLNMAAHQLVVMGHTRQDAMRWMGLAFDLQVEQGSRPKEM